MKIGTIIENPYAGNYNPHKRLIYIGRQNYLATGGRVIHFDKKTITEFKIVGFAFVDNLQEILAYREELIND